MFMNKLNVCDQPSYEISFVPNACYPVVKLLHVMLQGLYSIQQSNRNNTLHSIKCQIFYDTPATEQQPKKKICVC